MNDRQRLTELIDHLEQRWAYRCPVTDVDRLTDREVGLWLEVLMQRRRCFVEGEAAGWWPKASLR